MLELYHNINSVCAQKVRIAFAEKGVAYGEHLLTLQGDQLDPAYLALNPNGVVPTLVHDGRTIIESSVILYYLDELFPAPSLMPRDLVARSRVRLFNKLIDEYVHNSCTILSFATAFRARLARLDPAAREAELAKAPLKKRAEYKRDVIAHGLASPFVAEALAHHLKLLGWMEQALAAAPHLAGERYSLADAAVIPYILRLELLKLAALWDRYPAVAGWWERMRRRTSTEQAIFGRMSDADWQPFRTLAPDPWPAVSRLLAA